MSSSSFNFFPPLEMILPSDHNFADDEAALFLSLPPHFEYTDTNENRTTATVENILQRHHLKKNVAQLPTPIATSRRFTDIEAAIYLSITGHLPPNYEYTNSSHTASTATPPYQLKVQPSTATNSTSSPSNLISEPFSYIMLHSITISFADTA